MTATGWFVYRAVTWAEYAFDTLTPRAQSGGDGESSSWNRRDESAGQDAGLVVTGVLDHRASACGVGPWHDRSGAASLLMRDEFFQVPQNRALAA